MEYGCLTSEFALGKKKKKKWNANVEYPDSLLKK
jgi:hypothetical protein